MYIGPEKSRSTFFTGTVPISCKCLNHTTFCSDSKVKAWKIVMFLLGSLAKAKEQSNNDWSKNLHRAGMLLKRGTGNGERGTGNGSLGVSGQRFLFKISKWQTEKLLYEKCEARKEQVIANPKCRVLK